MREQIPRLLDGVGKRHVGDDDDDVRVLVVEVADLLP